MTFILCHAQAQQIATNDNLNPSDLLESIIDDGCISISNVESNTNGMVNGIPSYGYFERNNSNFPLTNGIILSTGNINRVGNNLITESLSDGEIDWSTDADLENTLNIQETLNATTLEFDIVSANDFISFNYIFASEEYQQEYPCDINDVFAILIKPSGSEDPYTNIAHVPNTATAVGTSTIRPNISGFCDAQNVAYFDGYNFQDTNLRGRTILLNAQTAIVPGESYHVKFVIADHVDQRFDSSVFISANSFGASINLGEDVTVCGNSLTLDASVNNNQAIYNWFLNGTQIIGENSASLNVQSSGNYAVEVTIPFGENTCFLSDDITVEVLDFVPAQPIEDLYICDENPSDNLTPINFETITAEVLANLPSNNYNISYHFSEEEALNNSNGYNTNVEIPQENATVYVRIESLDGSCLQLGSFNIFVNIVPNTNEDYTITMCGRYFLDGIKFETANYFDFEIANFEFNRTVSLHTNELDAENDANAISSSFEIAEDAEIIFARVEDQFSGCFKIQPIPLIRLQEPDLQDVKFFLSECSFQEFIFFPLGPVREQVFDVVGPASVTFHRSFGDALVQSAVILEEGITNQEPNRGFAYMYIKPEGTECGIVAKIDLFVNLPQTLLGESNLIERCDDLSNDGVLEFDLEEVNEELTQGYDLDITYYESENDRFMESNPLDISTPYLVSNYSKTLYIRGEYEGCLKFSEVDLKIYDTFLFEPKTYDYCGAFDPESETTLINLGPLREFMADIPTAVNIVLYESETDALENINALGDTLETSEESLILYAKARDFLTGCSKITTLTINISSNIIFNPIEDIIVCDDDDDNTAQFNLETVIPIALENNLNNEDLILSFYNNYTDALNNTNAIVNPSDYTTGTTQLFLRAEREGLSCFSLAEFNIVVTPKIEVSNLPNFISCQDDINLPGDYILNQQDEIIINNQENLNVLYFETLQDAQDRVNAIDKNQPYQNTNNFQTIYVRLENENYNSCFKITTFELEIRQAPEYNVPTDIPVCGFNGNGPYQIDLNTKIQEIINGSPHELTITFHPTPLNAELGTNAVDLNYTTSANPDTLYARITNNNGCYEVSEFNINIIDLPDVVEGQSLEVCGTYDEDNLTWDLTAIELSVLAGRQFNLSFAYFKSYEEAETDLNSIENPEDYSNLSATEVLYLKVLNNTTQCYNIVPFTLIVNQPPEIAETSTFNFCDNTSNTINLNEISQELLINNFNVEIFYYTSLEDAQNEINNLDSLFTYNATNAELYARITRTTTGCFGIIPINIQIDELPQINPIDNLEACQEFSDGTALFNLTNANDLIFQDGNLNNFNITFYRSEADALSGSSPLGPNYYGQNEDIIYARVENITTGCYTITSFGLIVHPLPELVLQDQVICSSDEPLVVDAFINANATYLWSTGSTSSSIEISEIGVYSVNITNEFGCEYSTSFEVSSSESAIINTVDVLDFSDPNNITLTITGSGNYRFQLNDGPFQLSPIFNKVPLGYNEITITDLNGCSSVTREVLVIDAPKFFTPNNDGNFDTWHITGIETLPGSEINIFDRYGKLIINLNSNSAGWDGTYNNHRSPADDYWYVAHIIKDGIMSTKTGHFSLRR